MKKIVYCIPSLYNSGGIERVLTTKANYLVETGWDVFIVTTCQKTKPIYFPLSTKVKTVDLGINYEDFEKASIAMKLYKRIRAKWMHKRKMRQLLLQIRPDITISVFSHEMRFLYKIHDGSKKLLELHFSKYFRLQDASSKGKGRVFKLLLKIADGLDRSRIKYYNAFVVLTEEDARIWGKMNNLHVIPNPITVEAIEIPVYRPQRVIAVGRLCPQKGFDMLLECWSMIDKDKRKGWTLDIFGDGPDKEKLKEKIRVLEISESVIIHAPVTNIEKQFLNSSICCITSRYEGFPLVLCESMACGVTPVSFACPCGPSDIIHDSENGFLIPLGDTKAFASKLQELMGDRELREKIGCEAKASVEKRYNLNIVMQQWLNLFNSLL